MQIKAILWDFSGVLFMSKYGLGHEYYAELMGIPNDILQSFFDGDMNRLVDLGEISHEDFYRTLLKELNLSEDMLPLFSESFRKAFKLNLRIIEYIQSLPESIKIGLLSNYSNRLRPLIEEDLEIAHLFDDMVISCEVKLLKPDEKIYQTALSRLNVEAEEAIFVDDRLENIEGAQKVGMHGVLFTETKQVINEINHLLS